MENGLAQITARANTTTAAGTILNRPLIPYSHVALFLQQKPPACPRPISEWNKLRAIELATL